MLFRSFHRGHEHSGRIAHLADELDLPEFDVFAWDSRGHGRSPGPRGDSPSFGASVRDVQCFIDHIRDTYGIEDFETQELTNTAQLSCLISRGKPELFADHYSQARLFWQSQTPAEQQHIIAAYHSARANNTMAILELHRNMSNSSERKAA